MQIWSEKEPIFSIGKISAKNFVENSNSDFFPKLWEVNFQLLSASILYLAGEEQRHYIHNTFNVLVNEGFLRNQQGFATLEVVHKFYEITKLTPIKVKKAEIDILDLCPRGPCVHTNQAVITCVQIDSTTNASNYHAAKVST